ncbi:MAG TPA: carbon monoxide dehydrogenase subunit G [Longimicrobium sp.]|nr:carbon monoxide dehydrogenase subunit G [Longimicrobium sp.]
MIVDGEFTFRAPRRSVWVLLQDPDVLVKAMPGAQRLIATGDGTYEGTVRIGVGPVTAAQWTLSVALHDREEPRRYMMKVDTKGPLGFTRGSASVELAEDGDATTMRYHADLQIGGKVAGIGQRLLDQVAKQLTRKGLEALSREMELRLKLSLGGASASFAVGTSAVVDGELVDAEDDDTDDAAAANPESGDAPDSATASSVDVDATPSDSTAQPDGDDGSDDAPATDGTHAHPVEPLAEVASADAPLPPGMAGGPAPVEDLDSRLPPGTGLRGGR